MYLKVSCNKFQRSAQVKCWRRVEPLGLGKMRCKSDTATPKRMPASVSGLCSRLYLAGKHAAEFLPVSGNVAQAAAGPLW